MLELLLKTKVVLNSLQHRSLQWKQLLWMRLVNLNHSFSMYQKWIADSTWLPQCHIGFSVSWKLCLNLCSQRWLSPSRIHIIYLIPYRPCMSATILFIWKWTALILEQAKFEGGVTRRRKKQGHVFCQLNRCS